MASSDFSHIAHEGDLRISRLGLGCSRLGSIGANGSSTAQELLQTALEFNVRFLDTADIYGQGDSESSLGKFLAENGRENFVIATKVGQYFPWYFSGLFLVKGTVKKLTQLAGLTSALRAVRSRTLPQNFSPSYIERKFAESLKRLKMNAVDVLLLHSPSAEVLREKTAVSALQSLKERGLVKKIGSSCDDAAALDAALDDERIEAVQVSLEVLDGVDATRLRAAREKGLIVIAREIFGGVRPAASAPLSSEFISERLAYADAHPNVDVILIGTTNHRRLRRLLTDYQSTRNSVSHAV